MIIDVFIVQVIDNEKFNNETEQTFVADLLNVIGGTPNFDFVLNFLEDADRDKMKYLMSKLDKVDDESKKNLEKKFESL